MARDLQAWESVVYSSSRDGDMHGGSARKYGGRDAVVQVKNGD